MIFEYNVMRSPGLFLGFMQSRICSRMNDRLTEKLAAIYFVYNQGDALLNFQRGVI